MSERIRIGLGLVRGGLRNARTRNRVRVRDARLQSKAIDTALDEAAHHLRKLSVYIKRVQSLEAREQKAKELEKRRRSIAGQNTRLTGTVGKS